MYTSYISLLLPAVSALETHEALLMLSRRVLNISCLQEPSSTFFVAQNNYHSKYRPESICYLLGVFNVKSYSMFLQHKMITEIYGVYKCLETKITLLLRMVSE